MDDVEITGALLGQIYEAAPEGAQREIRAAMGAILWRAAEVRLAARSRDGLALKAVGWMLVTDDDEQSLRDATSEVSDLGDWIKSASWMIGADEEKMTRHEKAAAVADVNRMLGYGESE